MTDLDQGGTARNWVRTYFGPTVGWVMIQVSNILPVSAAGATSVPAGTTLVTVDVAGAVTLNLPSSLPPSTPPLQPLAQSAQILTIVDIGGNAGTPGQEITIVPFGAETIMGQASIDIAANYGSFALVPLTGGGGWGQQ